MKISVNWLKTLINTDLAPQVIADMLTASGLEVEGTEFFESIPGGLRGIVVGEVIEKEKHPEADRLSLTKVDVGTGTLLNIVCGAPNVAAGQKVLVATIGAKLYPISGEPFEIKKSKIRGAASEGMICAEDEIGTGHSHDGILVLPAETPVGMPAADYFKLESDTVLEIGLTPNRGDAASHLGVARDLAAILNTRSRMEEGEVLNYEATPTIRHELPSASNLNVVNIEIQAQEAAPRYSGLVVSGVTVKESPEWLKNRLKSIGVRPINNIVDITNFVLHELGQPLHAFDLEKIKGNKVIVRYAKEGEKFVTLDGVERSLNAFDLMICNADQPMCIAGVFGGQDSGVTESTKAIFLESAYFDPGTVRKGSKAHGLKTDASFRFERGTDPELTVIALKRAFELIQELAGGVLSMDIVDLYPEKLEPYKIAFSYSNCQRLIGKEIDKAIIRSILVSLGIQVVTEGADGLLLNVPRYKTDVTREADLVEEVMRIYGYNNVEVSEQIRYTPSYGDQQDKLKIENTVADYLSSNGFSEMMNLSLSKESLYTQENIVKVMNPLSSDLNVMRPSMIYSGLETIAYNSNRKMSDLKVYEFGRTYEMVDAEFKYKEQRHLSIFATGRKYPENAYGDNAKVSFAYIKGIVDILLKRLNIKGYSITETEDKALTYGLSYTAKKQTLVAFGLVAKAEAKKFDLAAEVYYADINWDLLLQLLKQQPAIEFKELSKFPEVRRDLALLLDKAVPYQQVMELAFASERKLLKAVNLFDIYEGDKLEAGKKSYALSYILQDDQATLTDKQIEAIMQKLIKAYQEKLGASLRA